VPNALFTLESRRSRILRAIAALGDLRPGSITATGGKCGNPRCRCHQPGEPAHGPYLRLTRKVSGKTVTETFSTPAALAKARSEVAEFHRFLKLSAKLLEVNEKICALRPVPEDEPQSPNHARNRD
jgi:hypothetical protein